MKKQILFGEFRYYLDEKTQTLRRYGGGVKERWSPSAQAWVSLQCCEESACRWDLQVDPREVPFLLDPDLVEAAKHFLATGGHDAMVAELP